ncbi:MAG: hypothetical protein HYU57_03970 [Micavibrio aeruginosavorus]|nr:hypothetical protein [Micavibrio aeruginosavorus]
MAKATENFNRTSDLSTAEKSAMDDLGRSLPCLGGKTLSHTFSAFVTMGWKGRHNIGANGEEIVRYNLYTALPGGDFTRMPQVSFTWSENVHAAMKDAAVHVDFITARGRDDAENRMIPVNVKAPRNAAGEIDASRIASPAARSVLGFVAAMENKSKENQPKPAPKP